MEYRLQLGATEVFGETSAVGLKLDEDNSGRFPPWKAHWAKIPDLMRSREVRATHC